MVVVEREAEAQSLEPLLAPGDDVQPSVRELTRECPLEPAVNVERGREEPVPERPRRVARVARREREHVRAGGPHDGFDHA